jgi:hypothetical protein
VFMRYLLFDFFLPMCSLSTTSSSQRTTGGCLAVMSPRSRRTPMSSGGEGDLLWVVSVKVREPCDGEAVWSRMRVLVVVGLDMIKKNE